MARRGVWQHRRLKNPDMRLAFPIVECLNWNLYIGHKEVKQIDTRCKRCGQRVRFVPDRATSFKRGHFEKRGAPRQVRWLGRPDTMPRWALIKEVRARNEFELKAKEFEGFKRANETEGESE